MLSIRELLRLRGLDVDARVKLVRHRDTRHDVDDLRRRGLLELYQRYQSNPVFECDSVVSFVGLEHNRARLHGVYRVRARVPAEAKPLPEDSRSRGSCR